MSVAFRYRAATPDGVVLEGISHTGSRAAALEELRLKRLYVIEVEEANDHARRVPSALRLRARSQLLAIWTRNLAVLLAAHIPLDRSRAITAGQTTDAELTAVTQTLCQRVRAGLPFSDALAEHPAWFGAADVALVAAGEESGALANVLERMADYREQAAELRAHVVSTSLYPLLMALVTCLGVLVLMIWVVPRFADAIGGLGQELPFTTRVLVGVSNVLARTWWIWLMVLVLAPWGIRRALRAENVRMRFHRARLQWPLVGRLEQRYIAAGFTRTLAILLQSGVPLLSALRFAQAALTNLSVHEAMRRGVAAVAEGTPLSSALSGVLPRVATEMIAVGEETSRLPDMCARVAALYDAEVRRVLRRAVSLIEPAMILTFGLLVAFVALAMLQAIYNLNTLSF
ncbi:MAG TPA: type II secretion system F family protein [Longimicrobiales bacterium]